MLPLKRFWIKKPLNMKILVTGDFVITDEFQGHDLLNETVLELFKDTDYRIVNLEAPVTVDNPSNKILKTGPQLRSSPQTTLPYLKQLNVDMVTLANNHVLDYGQNGLNDTLAFCAHNNISTVGAGKDINEAQRPKRLEIDGKTISIINFAENEWASASAESGGAHPVDIIDNARLINSEKDQTDIIIVIIHGGHEYYPYPSPRMQKQYRYYVDQGADAVIGHHPHCISGYEVYKDSPIVYSLGNFIFTKPSIHNEWYTGLVCSLLIGEKDDINFKLIAVTQDHKSFRLTTQLEENANRTKKMIEEINSIIKDEKLLRKKWDEFIESKFDQYYWMTSPFNFFQNRYAKAVVKRLGLHKHIMSLGYKSSLLNSIRCEAHKDALISILAEDLKN